ncbi:uncharacterized protein LOC126705411 isoform X4 [Quercus robur]|nr:uncharacterized protein LOC126705411 isoform X4 [Quercus robur]XP_050260370.1 uncharacterized protein LOC126705411 isoform X4 [Quercus robur]
MAEQVKVLPNCVHADNPFHECSQSCLKKIAEGQTRKEKKKSNDGNGVIRTHPACPKASNPYHECGELCPKRVAGAEVRRDKNESDSLILDVSKSFGRKKKEVSRPNSPQVPDNLILRNTVDPYKYASKKKVEAENGKDVPHSQRHAKATQAQDPSFNKEQVQSIQSVPASGYLSVPDLFKFKDPSKENGTRISKETPNDEDDDEKLHAPPHSVPNPIISNVGDEDDDEKLHAPSYSVPNPIISNVGECGAASDTGPASLSVSFSFSGIADALEGSDDEEAHSVISDSCVSVGKYHVKESLASILQSIFDKYGDIAASCHLESNAIRSYYLECVCTVVKELQSISVMQLTKSKVKELSAILKDVETSQIDISWLQGIINDITVDVELINHHRSIEVAKADCDHDIKSTREELESLLEQVADTRARLSELELKSSQLNETMLSIKSKTENFQGRSLLSEL